MNAERALETLFTLVGDNNVDGLQQLLRIANVNLDGVIGRGMSAIAVAVQRGYMDMVQALIAAGADVNFGGRIGGFPLFIATRLHNEAMVDILLAAGARTQLQYVNGNTALLEATSRGQLALVKKLIAAGSDVFTRNNGGDTGLHIAAAYGNQDILMEYINAGVPVDILKYDGIGRKRETSSGLQPLHLAAYGPAGGHAHIAEILLARGADVNARMSNGRTALNLAATRNAMRIGRVLLAHNCDLESISMENEEHKTPLHNAIDNNTHQIAELLIDSGADIEAVNQWGLSPLISAVFSGNVTILMKLLQAGANVNHCSRNGMTALEASLRADTIITLMLLHVGCVLTQELKARALAHFQDAIVTTHAALSDRHYMAVCDILCSVKSLRQVCRLQIRSALAHRPNSKIAKLPVPLPMQEYLKLESLGEMCKNYFYT